MAADSNGDEGPPPKRKGKGEQASTFGRMVAYSHVAYVFIGAFGIPTALGIWIDSRGETQPWGTIVGVTVGLVLSTIVAYREVRTTGTRLKTPPTGGGKPQQRR